MFKDFEAILDSNSSHSFKWLSEALLVSLPHIRPSLALHPSPEWANTLKLTQEGLFPLWKFSSTSASHQVHLQLCGNSKNTFYNLSDFSSSWYSGSVCGIYYITLGSGTPFISSWVSFGKCIFQGTSSVHFSLQIYSIWYYLCHLFYFLVTLSIGMSTLLLFIKNNFGVTLLFLITL